MVHVTDADVAAYFAKNHATLDTKPQVRARHILVADEKTADMIEAKLKAGGNFADLAKQYSTDPSTKDKGGELGFFSTAKWCRRSRTRRSRCRSARTSAPVKSPFGWHIINVEEKKPADRSRRSRTRRDDQDHAHATATAAADPGVPPAAAREGEHPGQRRPLQGRVPARRCRRRRRPPPPAAAAPSEPPAAAHPELEAALRRLRAARGPIRRKRSTMLRIVGLGPGDPDLLTLGSREAMRAVGRAVTVLAPPDLVLFLESEGVAIQRGLITDQRLFIRGSTEVIDGFVERIDGADLALGILGNPLSDFAGLPMLLRALERRRIVAEIVPGMPRATLSAAVTMPLLPLPPGSSHQNWDDLVQIMARLRRSCPWDREQSTRALVRYLVEEAYEVVDAIEGRDEAELCEELGDLLFQVVFHAQLATERGKFSVADVIDSLSNKMIRRHPHVFGDVAAASVAEVWQNWDQLKSLEASSASRTSKLDGIPSQHAGLATRPEDARESRARGLRLARCARSHGKTRGRTARVCRSEARKPANSAHEDPHVREELGDVLFTVVNLARKMNIDAEGAMRDANAKFNRRFRYMELYAPTSGRETQRYDARRTRRSLAGRQNRAALRRSRRRASFATR